jgi:hypothetical protein
MRSAFFVVVASIFGDSAFAATPADHVTGTHYPAYGTDRDAGAFRVTLNIVVKGALDADNIGRADFSINVRFPDGKVVDRVCANEEYLFEDGSMLFNPYDEPGNCTGEFVAAMNAKFRAMGATTDVVSSPISLAYTPDENSLTFNAIGGVNVEIPATTPVPKAAVL